MATSRDFDAGCDEYSNLKCSICAKKKKVANANYYCYDCQKHLCTYCLATHNEFNENHNVVQGLGDDKDVITEKCGKHADELITLYCRQDDELLCRKCRLLEHRKCQEPQNIRESSAELNGDPELQTVPAELKSALDNINKAIEALDQHVVAFYSTQVDVYNAVSLTRTRTIELGHYTSKIACHGGLLYCDATGGWGYNFLYVHDVSDGRKLREFRLNIYYIQDITGIAVNGPGDRLYVTDWRGLLCYNMDGQQIFHLSEKDLGLSEARGVTTDHHGHVLVCGCKSNNVVKVTEDGHVVGEILSGRDGIKRPVCLSYDVSRSLLCVGGESDQILTVEWK